MRFRLLSGKGLISQHDDFKRSISQTICGGLPSCETTKGFLDVIAHKLKQSDKAENGNLLESFTNARYDKT